jgi:hypothetical protein
MAYSILKSEYPGCFFWRLTDHCTVISSKDGKVKTGWSYSTCLYVLYGNVLFINTRYYSSTTARHRARLLEALNAKGGSLEEPIEITLSESNIKLLASDLLCYKVVSQYTLQNLAKAWQNNQQWLKWSIELQEKTQAKLDKLVKRGLK